jgi:beta-lactamase regulating signal transducer with metallopeptidase domain/biotin carboxyl carrier protein
MTLADLMPVANHLWQSTVFAVAAGVLTFVFRKNRAHVRYWLWSGASVKFLVPFTLLMSAGGHLQRARTIPRNVMPAFASTVSLLAEPFPGISSAEPMRQSGAEWVFITIAGVWACGFAAVACMRLRGWLRIQAALRSSMPLELRAAMPARISPGLLEPGVVGLFRPVLLLPEGIVERLTPGQFEAVLAHELCHARRRDNLTSAIHMAVEAVCWFHPLVWWIGARLLEEREHACDEAVLSLGAAPQEYAEAILNVCKSYIESPLRCVSGVTGSNLKRRMQAILAGRVVRDLNPAKKLALGAAGLLAVTAPIAIGIMHAPATRAQAQQPEAEAPRVMPPPGRGPGRKSGNDSGTTAGRASVYIYGLGNVAPYTVTVKSQIDGQLLSLAFNEGSPVAAGQLLASIDPHPWQIQLAQAEGVLAQDEAQAIASTPPATTPELRGRIQADQASVDIAKIRLSYTQVRSPIAGVAGLRPIEPGNIVHAGDILVVVTRLQPIAVIFSVPEDALPEVLARQREGASVPAEAWNRDNTAKLATGRLTAVDNMIDTASGTAKLKATFDNKDGALFPNQFVNVRLLLRER